MRSTSFAIWLGTLLLLTCPGVVSAGEPSYWTWGCNNGHSCGAIATAWLHQHGPLYNYGPYYGYPPFEPYGPWNAYLQFNPCFYGYPERCCAGGHDLSGHGPLCDGGHSWHSSWALGGWFHGCSTCAHGGLFTGHAGWHQGIPCDSCGCGSPGTASPPPAKPTAPPQTAPKAELNPEFNDAVARCSGIASPAAFNGYYAGLPTLNLRLAQAGETGK